MIKSLSHGLVAAIICAVSLAFNALDIGIAVAMAFYLGREVAQHEAKTTGSAIRGFYFWNWTLQTWLDLIAPAAVCVLIKGLI